MRSKKKIPRRAATECLIRDNFIGASEVVLKNLTVEVQRTMTETPSGMSETVAFRPFSSKARASASSKVLACSMCICRIILGEHMSVTMMTL